MFLVLALLNFVLQIYPRFYNKYFGVDVWTRLLEIEHIRKNNHEIPRHNLGGQFMIDGYFDYPPIFPFIMSYVPKDVLFKYQAVVSPFFDTLQCIFVYILALHIFGNMTLALIAQAAYILTPMIALENSYLTPRSLGYFTFTLAVVSLLLYLNDPGRVILYVSGCLFVVVLFLTHRFATQAFVFLSLFFTFYMNTPIFIQALLLGFTGAIIVTRGNYLRVLRGHLYNIYFWVKNLDYRFSHQVRGIVKKGTKVDFVNKVYGFLTVFSPLAVFALVPSATGAVIAFAGYYAKAIPLAPLLLAFSAWVTFFYIFGVIVLKTKYLMPIGEGQRYLEMATVPSSILTAYLISQAVLIWGSKTVYPLVVIAGVVIFILIMFVQVKGVIKDKGRSLTGDMQQVFGYINALGTPVRIICIPHQNTTVTVYNTKASVLVNADNRGLMDLIGVFPILTTPLKDLTRRYNLTHALINESFVNLSEVHLSEHDVEYSSGKIKLVKLI